MNKYLALAMIVLAGSMLAVAGAAQPEKCSLIGDNLSHWRSDTGQWHIVGSVSPNPQDPKLLASQSGSGVLVTGPTRAATYNDEKSTGPLMLQGDHGPVAYRNIWVRPLLPDTDPRQ